MATARRLQSHQYPDNIQVYGWRPRSESHVLRDQLSNCVEDICLWMCNHRLQLITSKTEFIWCCPSRRRQHLPDGDFVVGANQVQPIPSARYRIVYVDGEMSPRSHISHVAASCFSALRQIRSIRRSLSSFALEALVTSLFHSRLDYCNVDIEGLPSILNASVRLVAGACKYDHVTPLLRDRHWLPIAKRVEYKLCTLVFRCLHGSAPSYFADLVRPALSTGRRSGLGSAAALSVDVPRTRTLLGDRAFSVAGPCAWYSLPLHVRSAQSMLTFIKLLKSHLFQRAYQ
jgi:hypothetical protein